MTVQKSRTRGAKGEHLGDHVGARSRSGSSADGSNVGEERAVSLTNLGGQTLVSMVAGASIPLFWAESNSARVVVEGYLVFGWCGTTLNL